MLGGEEWRFQEEFAMDIKPEWVELSVSDGTAMRAYAARPYESVRGGLIIGQEAFGVNAHIRDVTERFAREGYVAIAPELFHRTAPPGFEAAYGDMQAVMPHVGALQHRQIEADLSASYGWLYNNGCENEPVGAVGFCMGGAVAFLAGLTQPVAAAVSFYGGGIAPSPQRPGLLDRVNQLHAPVLFFWGGLDKHLGQEQVRAVTDAMRAAKKDFINVEISDADHGFFCDARPSYNAHAAEEAWDLTLSFLDEHMTVQEKAISAD
jgi:carboxymethylenebutenolidase